MLVIKKLLQQFSVYLKKRTEESAQQINLFAIVMMINFPLFGLIWKVNDNISSQEVCLRLSATFLCALLLSNRFWPRALLKYLPFLWYATLLFCLPFFFSYLTLLHHASTLWLMNCVSGVFFLLLVTRVLDALVLMALGFCTAFLCFFGIAQYQMYYIPGEISAFGLLATFTAAIIIGTLFARDREIIQDGRLSGMRLLAGSLAHDLRTSLASIHMQAELQELIVQKLSESELQRDLRVSLNKMVRGIEMGNQLISMQLNNIRREKFDTEQFVIQPIRSLLDNTLKEYPVKLEHQGLVTIDLSENFFVWVESVAFKNLIWNLLKNSLDCIEESGKGCISIWLSLGSEEDDFNYLHIKDTAKGIYPKQAERVFDSFYSNKKGGTGVGLAYCKLFMQAAGGDIICEGKYNQYAHFILKFPKID